MIRIAVLVSASLFLGQPLLVWPGRRQRKQRFFSTISFALSFGENLENFPQFGSVWDPEQSA